MKIEYQIFHKAEFDKKLRVLLAKMLEEQGKIQGNFNSKIDRCKLLCVATIDNNQIAIGAIKQKTSSDFDSQKAGLSDLCNDFEWELGYLYTQKDYEGHGLATNIVRLLINSYGNDNLMASTEITDNPAMVKILKKNGFRLFGKPWKSSIHNCYLGLFLKFR